MQAKVTGNHKRLAELRSELGKQAHVICLCIQAQLTGLVCLHTCLHVLLSASHICLLLGSLCRRLWIAFVTLISSISQDMLLVVFWWSHDHHANGLCQDYTLARLGSPCLSNYIHFASPMI